MTLEELRARKQQVADELHALDAKVGDRAMSGADAERWNSLSAEYDGLAVQIEQTEQRHARTAELARAGHVEPGADDERTVPNIHRGSNPFTADIAQLVHDPVRSRDAAKAALAHLERTVDAPSLQRADGILEHADPRARAEAVVHADPDYRTAFIKMIARGPQAGRDMLNDKERRAVERAMSLTDANGGYGVPFTLDPTWILTNDGAANPIRQLARVAPITTDTWNGVATAGVSGGFKAEAAESTDGAPTFEQPTIKAERADIFVPVSIEASEDIAQLAEELALAFADEKNNIEAAAFINGTGTNEPTGIVTALTGTASEVDPATAETFTSQDVYDLLAALPPRHRNNRTAFIAALSTLFSIRQFDTTGGADMWEQLGMANPDRLIGVRVEEASEMDPASGINPAATADNRILVVGDWRHYVIAERVGMRVEMIPHLFATANNRPSGTRGYFAYWRVGADSVNDNAFRMLNVATTA